jgi:hypothetical protein
MNAAEITEDRVETLRGLLSDVTSKMIEQRQRIAELEAALKDQLGYIELWFDDVECGLKPYLDGFERAENSILTALKGAA